MNNKEKLQELIQAAGLETVKNLLTELETKKDPKVEMTEFLDSILDGITLKKDSRYPQSLFYYKDNRILMEQDWKNSYLWINYEKIWSFFESKFHLKYNEIQLFIQRYMEEYLNLKGFTPRILATTCNT